MLKIDVGVSMDELELHFDIDPYGDHDDYESACEFTAELEILITSKLLETICDNERISVSAWIEIEGERQTSSINAALSDGEVWQEYGFDASWDAENVAESSIAELKMQPEKWNVHYK